MGPGGREPSLAGRHHGLELAQGSDHHPRVQVLEPKQLQRKPNSTETDSKHRSSEGSKKCNMTSCKEGGSADTRAVLLGNRYGCPADIVGTDRQVDCKSWQSRPQSLAQ
jgi:hypothetical protein